MPDYMETSPPFADAGPAPLRIRTMSFLVAVILAGALPFFAHFLDKSTWILWGLLVAIIISYSRELRLSRLLSSLTPYLLWLCFYFIWGFIIATRKEYHFIFKILATTLILGTCMAIISSSPRYLRTFATAIQFSVIGNLLLLGLSSWSPRLDAIIQTVTLRSAAATVETSYQRYGGLWGNPNTGAYICLLVVILSIFAVPWAAWLGRLSCVPIFYLSASRKGAVLFLLILMLYMAIVKGRNLKVWLGGMALVVTLVIAFTLSASLRRESHSVAQNAYLARMLDLQENYAAERGAETRIDLLKDWLAVLPAEPWYGYGLNAMSGTQMDEEDPGKVVQKGLVDNGTHNTYLGIWIDIGPVGFFAFLLMIFHYTRRSFTTPGPPAIRWLLISLAMVNVIFLFVSHSQLTCFEGEIAYTLLFLLPTSPGLRSQYWNRLPAH